MLAALVLGAALLAGPQDSTVVRAMLAAERIASGTSTVLVISVETSGATPAEIPVPTLPAGLELGPISDFSQLQIAFPGGRRRTTRREIVLIARAPGRYRIPSVPLEVQGRRHATSPLTLTVVSGTFGRAPATGLTGEPAVQLRAWVEPDTVYAGAQILYRAEASFPEELRLRQTRAPVFDPPATTGFWVYDVPDPVTVGLRVVGDATFEVQSFRQVLFPLHPGDHTIPAAGMRYEFRAGSIFTPEARQLASEALRVHVRALPADNRPPAFTGAVGSYTLDVALSAARAAAGDAVTLSVSIEGTGNIKALARPVLPPIPGIDVYPGAERVDVGFADERVSGRKTFEWLLAPREPGRFTIPAIAFAWFDPGTERYHQASSRPLALSVTAGTTANADVALAPPRTRSARPPLAFVRAPWFGALQAVPLLVLLLVLWRRRKARRTADAGAIPAVDDELRAIGALTDTRACLERLGTLLQREVARGPAPGVAGLEALHERVRQARYAPAPVDAQTCARLLADARALLAAQRTRAARAAAARGLGLLWLLIAAGSLQAQELEPGLRALQTGASTAAVRAFVDVARARPGDAAAWYDLGLAFAARDERGRAAWAWLRTLQLEPRAADAHHNLRVLGAERARAALAPRVPLSSDELRLGAALGWWLACAGLVISLLRRRRALLVPAFGIALLCLAALAVLAYRARPPARALVLEDATLHAAPALRSDSVGSVPVAAPVRIRDLRPDWARVLGPDLREGWIERRLIGRL